MYTQILEASCIISSGSPVSSSILSLKPSRSTLAPIEDALAAIRLLFKSLHALSFGGSRSPLVRLKRLGRTHVYTYLMWKKRDGPKSWCHVVRLPNIQFSTLPKACSATPVDAGGLGSIVLKHNLARGNRLQDITG